jgi:pimeloyl-ACP methyl ester carboxylesterase
MSPPERAVRALLRMRGVRSRYVETDVARHHVYEADGRGDLGPVVMLPGLCDSAVSSMPVLLRLRARTRRVVVVESAGHGLSEHARGDYTVARHLASSTTVLDAVIDEPAILVGNSLGGATALHYACERPDRVRGLYLTSPGGAPFDDITASHIRRVFAMTTLAEARAFIGLVFHREPRAALLLAWLLRSRASTPEIAAILRTVDTVHLTAAQLAALRMPVTLVWGRSERMLSPAALAYFRTHMPPHVEITEPAEFGHCPHLDDPARLARLIVAFAARHEQEREFRRVSSRRA